ncbi:MAG: HAD hydrolase-like protein [Bacteroidales bacterium]|nr:HAD hydrolase-like protein [Bacteroidales bacterium]
MDGTLIDSKPGIFNSVYYTLEKLGIPKNDWPADLNPFIGPPLRMSFKTLFGFDEAMAELATATYREYYSKKGLYEFTIYDGIPEALQQLSEAGLKLSLVTSKAEIYALKITEKAGFSKFLETVSGCEINGQRSEKAELITWTLNKLGLAPSSKILMVGDRNFDISGARMAGISSAGVLYGYGSFEELTSESPGMLLTSPRDLISILK